MRRTVGLMLVFLLTAVLMTASPANAGYLIIRIILESGEGGGEKGAGSGTPGQPGGKMPGGGKMGSGNFKGGPGGSEAPSKSAKVDPSHCVVAVIPFDEDYTKARTFYPYQKQMSDSNPARKDQIRPEYRGEKLTANLFTDATTIQWYEDLTTSPAFTKTRASEVKEMYRKWKASKTDSRLLLNALNAALAIGMVDDAIRFADELLAIYTEASMADKAAFPPDVRALVTAYGKMQAGINGPPPKPAKTDNWQRKLGNAKVDNGLHYAVIYGDATLESDVTRRMSFLEENFKAFFLWHALRGVELPIPDAPLLVVLTNSGSNNQPGGIDVHTLAKALDGPARLTADGFYAPEHNLLILSPDRLDEVGVNFTRYTQPVYSNGIGRDKLITGSGPKLSVAINPDLPKPDDVARMQTIALVDRFVEDAAIACAISREGSRQLLYTTRQLPKYVDLPLWLSNGAGNFFARPKEPAFVHNDQGKPVMCVAAATGYGVANYALHRYFKDFYKDLLDRSLEEAKKREDPKFDPDGLRVAVLKNVLTDAYFRALADPRELRDPDPSREKQKGIALGAADSKEPGAGQGAGAGGPARPMGGGLQGPGGARPPGMGTGPGNNPPPKAEEDPQAQLRRNRERVAIKAQATSWALYYYLAKDRPGEFQAFENELAALPRDLPLEGASVAAFYRAFNLDPTKEESLKLFARKWFDYIHIVAPAGVDVVIHEPKKEEKKDGAGFPGPGFPGKQ